VADKKVEDVLLKEKSDRRLLSHVTDSSGLRTNRDRRGQGSTDKKDYAAYMQSDAAGRRYQVDYKVDVLCDGKHFQAKAVDVSTTGMLLQFDSITEEELNRARKLNITFEITPGSMPEGYEMRVKKLPVHCVRTFRKENEDFLYAGVQFDTSLAEYVNNKKGKYMLAVASFFLFTAVFVIIMMRAESVIYFRFNKYLYLYSIVAATLLLSRYFFGGLYRAMPVDINYTPGVTIIIPCFNEEKWIRRTILCAINQDYPPEQLEVIVVDDCSTDHSLEKIKETVEELQRTDHLFNTKDRIRYVKQPVNKGKREAMALGAKLSTKELLVFVDSDSFLDPFAVRNIVQPFKDEKMGGVSGRTDVANTYTNSLTKMQSVRYYIAFRIMKAAEGYFDAVTCLSGPLSCYRKDLVLKYSDAWLSQTFLGQRATFGDDRSMTNFILRHHRTGYQDTAVCSTIVPNTHHMFLRQQMRWKRSWLRESLIASRYMWKKEPFMAIFFYMGVLVPIVAPVIVLYNMIYVPVIHRVFPLGFVVGMTMMAMLMSLAQLLLRRSSTWLYGVWFCIYYELVLLWQMPVAWFTFWKSNWGTRATPADVAEEEKRKTHHHKKE
jgi:hyaluronan synthase